MSETGDTDALAAEYVLGTLDAGERAQTQAMLTVDQALAAKVRIWERRLSELHLMVEPVDPDGEIWDRIKVKMTLVAPSPVVPPLPETVAPPVPPTPEPVIGLAPLPPEALPPSMPRATPSLEAIVAALTADEPVSKPDAGGGVEQVEVSPAKVDTVETVVAEKVAEGTASTESTVESAKTADVESALVETAKVIEPPPAVEEEPTPSGVFDDMPEPTPSGPLAPFPKSFTATKPTPLTLTPSPPATLSVPVPPPVAPPSPALAIRPERRPRPAPPPKSRWLARTIAWLFTLVLLALAGLVAAWRFVPDQVPPPLRPVEVLRSIGISVPVSVGGAPPRRPAPPESRYEE